MSQNSKAAQRWVQRSFWRVARLSALFVILGACVLAFVAMVSFMLWQQTGNPYLF